MKNKIERLIEIVNLIEFIPLACSDPIEYDYHEYAACEKCPNCKLRFAIDKLKQDKVI